MRGLPALLGRWGAALDAGLLSAPAPWALGGRRALSASPSPVEAEPVAEVDSFRASDLEYDLAVTQPQLNLEDLKFGTVFSDHMFLTEHVEGRGWSRPAIKPFGYLPMHPAAQVLHYGMGCFEGMKAYRGSADGAVRLFRPDRNMARLHRSARRLQLADYDPAELLACIRALLRVDRAWLPGAEGYSMYIRPFIFSSAHVLGVARASRTTVCTVLSPVGPYFPSGLRPITLFVEETHRRAWPGGAGDVKVGGNYAPTILPQVAAAAEHGAHQVIYTLPPGAAGGGAGGGGTSDDAVFEECGAMNIFFVLRKVDGGLELVTPPLTGTILPGITRDSILSLARSWGGDLEVSERALSVGEAAAAAAAGRLQEVFGSGTACIVQPVGALVRASGAVYRPSVSDPADPASLAARLHRSLLDIQYGRVPHPWSVPLEGDDS